MAVRYNRSFDSFSCQKSQRHGHCPIVRMSINRASTIIRFASCKIYVPIDCRHPLMRYWQPLGAETIVTRSLLRPENERQRSVNNFRSCGVGNQRIARLIEYITALFTALIGKNTIYHRKIMDFKIVDIANFKSCKTTLLAVEYTMLIRHYYQSAKTRAVYESIDGPAGQPSDNLPNSDRFGDFHWTITELTVRV